MILEEEGEIGATDFEAGPISVAEARDNEEALRRDHPQSSQEVEEQVIPIKEDTMERDENPYDLARRLKLEQLEQQSELRRSLDTQGMNVKAAGRKEEKAAREKVARFRKS